MSAKEVAITAAVELDMVSGAASDISVARLEAADAADSITMAEDTENDVFEKCHRQLVHFVHERCHEQQMSEDDCPTTRKSPLVSTYSLQKTYLLAALN